jgi:hypothetical protein
LLLSNAINLPLDGVAVGPVEGQLRGLRVADPMDDVFRRCRREAEQNRYASLRIPAIYHLRRRWNSVDGLHRSS